MSKRQLVLIETDNNDWRLDEETKRRGREGVAMARSALREALAAEVEAPAA